MNMLSALKHSLSALTASSSSGSLPVRRESAASYPGDHDQAASADGDGGDEGGYGRTAAQTATTPTTAIGASVPRVKHTMARIQSMMRKLHPEVLDTLSYAANAKQVADLQKMLQDYVIPKDVLDTYALHDGQDTFSVPNTGENGENEGNTGFIYGLWWMSIEEVMEEYTFWRRLDVSNPPSPATAKKHKIVNDAKGKGRQQHQTHTARVPSQDAFLFGSEMDPRTVRATMRACPEGFVRQEYSHPSWLPLLKDGYGNYIGIDLDPPTLSEDEKVQLDSSRAPPILPARGQVIAFGREIDTKTVLWNGWADSNAYDNLGGGGWARFLASFADDLSASPALHQYDRYRRDSSTRGGRASDDDDDDAYRSASGGRQEQLGSHSAGTALEWMDASPLYSGLGTIEALVERSRRIWSSVGMPMPLSSPAQEILPLFHGDAPSPFSPADGHSGSIDRERKPPPLTFAMPGTGLDAHKRDISPNNAPHPVDLGRSISNAQSAGSSGFTSNPESANTKDSRSAFIDDLNVTTALETPVPAGGDLDAATTALMQPGQDARPPMSPEPSLVLSPPSPKDNAEIFGPFPSMSPTAIPTTDAQGSNPTTPTTQQQPITSPTKRENTPGPLSAHSLASPARMSPGQAQRYAERQNSQQYQFQQRTASIDSGRRVSTSSAGSYGRSPAKRSSKPPPPAMPLGLPTLEFGNGIWEQNDTVDGDASSYGYEKNTVQVVIGGQR